MLRENTALLPGLMTSSGRCRLPRRSLTLPSPQRSALKLPADAHRNPPVPPKGGSATRRSALPAGVAGDRRGSGRSPRGSVGSRVLRTSVGEAGGAAGEDQGASQRAWESMSDARPSGRGSDERARPLRASAAGARRWCGPRFPRHRLDPGRAARSRRTGPGRAFETQRPVSVVTSPAG